MIDAVDLFCGAGGTSEGLRQAGVSAVGFELDRDACAAHTANGHLTVRADIESYPFRAVVWLVWGSPPCQPWSSGGDQLGAADERDMIPAYLAAVDVMRPAVTVMENVKGLTFVKNLPYLHWVVNRLRSFGYAVEWRVLDAADFGVPQNRERLIVIGRRDGRAIRWPAPTHTEGDSLFLQPWVTMADALGWGDDMEWKYHRGAGMIERHGDRSAYSFSAPAPAPAPAPAITTHAHKDFRVLRTGANSMVTGRTVEDIEPYERDVDRPALTVDTKAGGSWTLHTNRDRRPDGSTQTREAPAPAPAVTTKASTQWWRTRPATSVMCDPRVSPPGRHDPEVSGSQQAGAVKVTLEELAILQGFPAGYRFAGTRTEQARQIGNAVPPPLARAIVEALR